MWLSAGDPAPSAAMPTLLAVAVIAGVIFVFGYRLAVMRRANADYKQTKARLPAMRKSFWSAWWAAVKFGTGVLVVFALLLGWVGHELGR